MFKYHMMLHGVLKPSECHQVGRGFGQIVIDITYIVAEKA